MNIKKLDEDEILHACALRFDGYAYQRYQNEFGRGEFEFAPVIDRIEKTREFPDNELECLAAFFGLQRYLGKWGGETLGAHSPGHIVYRLLFLHLYKAEIPPMLRFEDYYETWERDYRPYREILAGKIRRTFKRRGRPTRLFTDSD